MTWGVYLSMSCLFAFSSCLWTSQGKDTEVVCHSLLQGTTFCQTSPPWHIHLGWPHTAWLSFTEQDKAAVRVIRLASCLWLWFPSVCPRWPLSVPTVLLGFLLPWMWGISSQVLQQSAATIPYLGHGIVPLSHFPWPWTWGSSSWPCLWLSIKAATLLHNKVLPKEHTGHRKHPPATTQEKTLHMDITQVVDTKIRLIIFFSAKDGEALYNQQKQDQELTVAQIINSDCQIQTEMEESGENH